MSSGTHPLNRTAAAEAIRPAPHTGIPLPPVHPAVLAAFNPLPLSSTLGVISRSATFRSALKQEDRWTKRCGARELRRYQHLREELKRRTAPLPGLSKPGRAKTPVLKYCEEVRWSFGRIASPGQ